MNYTEYQEADFIKAVRESLTPVIGKDATNYFIGRVYTEMEAQGRDIEKEVNTMTYRAKSGLIADMLYWAIGTKPQDGEDRLYWYLMERVLETTFEGKVLS